jgi:hypothetical protein
MFSILLIATLVLAACGGASQPTEQQPPPGGSAQRQFDAARAHLSVDDIKTILTTSPACIYHPLFMTLQSGIVEYDGDELKGISHYSNQWYVVDDDIALGIGSYGQHIVFNRNTRVAIAKFSTYPINPVFDMAAKDLPWLIEQARSEA